MMQSGDTHVVPSNIVLDRGHGPPWEGEIWGQNPKFSDVTYCQITSDLVITIQIPIYTYIILQN